MFGTLGHMNRRTPSALTREVATVLKGRRAMAGMSLQATAEAAGISFTTAQRLFAGKTELPLPLFVTLCELFGADPGEILNEAERRLISKEAGKSRAASVSPATVANIRFRDDDDVDWDAFEGRKAADYDSEADEDEPTHP